MKKRLISCLLALVLALSLLPSLSGTASAASPMPDFKLSADGKLSWSHAPGVKVYYLHGLDTAGTVAIKNEAFTHFDSKTWTSTGVIFDLQKYMDACGDYEEKTYTLTLSDQLNYYDPLNYESTFTFDYHSRIPKLATPQNLRWDGKTIRWDPVPNAGFYWVGVIVKPGTHAVWSDQPLASVTSEDLSLPSTWSGDPAITFNSDLQYAFRVRAMAETKGTYRDSDLAESETVTGAKLLKGYKTGDPFHVYVDRGTAKPADARPGETVTLTYTGMHGSHGSLVELDTTEFDHWEVVSGGAKLADSKSTTTTFIMPAGSDVYINGISRSKLCTVTFDANGGTGTMTGLGRDRGSDYTLPNCDFIPPTGKVFQAWQPEGSAGSYAPGDTLTLEQDVTFKALWKDAPALCTVTFDANGGSGAMAAVQVEKGGVITLPENGFTPPAGQQFRSWTIDGSPELPGAKKAIQGDTTVRAAWEPLAPDGPKTVNPFVDVKEGDYFYDAVLWAYYASPQVTKGISDTRFGPDATVTRGQAVAFLWRAMGEPEPTTAKNPFVDVKESDYYYKPVLWAVEKNITVGVDATHFVPGQTCSTAHIITFLYRTLKPGEGGPNRGWYEVAEAWARGDRLLDDTGLTVKPGIDCPRGAVVTFLYRELGKT